ALRKLTGDPVLADQIATNYRFAPLQPGERAMLEYVLMLTADSSSCTEDDVDELREAGWSDEDILDIAQVAAMFNFTNRLASGLGWVPNREYFALGR
ncbi:MAG: peroxidase-related enzyme, partial [Gaiellales bacterium]